MKNDRLLLFAFFLSGTAALGYEVLWTRLLALALGSESLGVLGVLAGFFGGLALGSWLLHERARQSPNPLQLFARLEVIAAIYALVSPFLLYGLARQLPAWLGPTAGDNNTPLALVLSLGIALLALLPATFCMGATLAALVEARRRALPEDAEGQGLGRLYAANTAGATCGVLVTVFFVLPILGMIASAVVLALLGLIAAALAIVWGRQQTQVEETAAEEVRDVSKEVRWVYPLLVLTGLAAVGLEVAGVHILAQILEDTVYTFAGALAMYLIGNAAGAALYATLAPLAKEHSAKEITVLLLFLQTVSITIAAISLVLTPGVLEVLAPEGSSYVRHVLAELLLAGWVFLTPTLVMGALFSHVVAQIAGRGVGKAYALNTLGGTLAPFIFGLFVLRGFGYATAFYAAAWIYGGLLLLCLMARWTSLKRGLSAVVVAALLLLIAPPSLILLDEEPGWKILAEKPGLYGLVRVTEATENQLQLPNPIKRLQINRHFRMGGSLSFGEKRMGHLPFLLKPEARTTLFLGVGTGATLSAVRHYPLEYVEAVEIVPEVLDVLPLFADINDDILNDPKIHFHTADARRHVAASKRSYDLIVGDLFHPARDGAGTLYSLQHFKTLAEHLEPGGLLVQWIPIYQFDEPNFKTVLRTFLDVFPYVHSMLGIYNVETPALALIGSTDEDLKIDLEAFIERLRMPIYNDVQMQDARDTLSAYMLSREALVTFAGDGPLNTDLAPTVLFSAPKSAYEDRADLLWGNLAALLDHREVVPSHVLRDGDPARNLVFLNAAASFSEALTLYLQAEVERMTNQPMPPEAVELYLQAFEAEPDFQPAQQILWRVALSDPNRAGPIFERALARDPGNITAHYGRLGYLERKGDHEQFALALAEAQERFGVEAFPDPADSNRLNAP